MILAKDESRLRERHWNRLKLSYLFRAMYSNKDKFQYILGWIELNFQDITHMVYHTSIAINILSSIK